MLNYRQLVKGFAQFTRDPKKPVIAHASYKAFGEIQGGPDALLGAILSAFPRLMMPAFTYQTMITPEVGPENNGMAYGGAAAQENAYAEFFSHDLPVHPEIGVLAETLRKHPKSARSAHPILSFCGIEVDEALNSQTLQNPFAPIGKLAEEDGFVLLLGVDHTANTAIHYAEALSARKQFTRWALANGRVVECPNFPGSAAGFQALHLHIERFVQQAQIGTARVQLIPLGALIDTVKILLRADPLALLAEENPDARTQAVLQSVNAIRLN